MHILNIYYVYYILIKKKKIFSLKKLDYAIFQLKIREIIQYI